VSRGNEIEKGFVCSFYPVNALNDYRLKGGRLLARLKVAAAS